MAATTSASSCSSFFSLRSSTADEPRHSTTTGGRGSPGCGGGGKLDGVGMWLVNGFAAAFFASLERLSCIRITTHEDDGEEANDVPLIQCDGNHAGGYDETSGGGGGVFRKRNKGKGLKKESGSFLED